MSSVIMLSESCSVCWMTMHAPLTQEVSASQGIQRLRWQRKKVLDQCSAVHGLTQYEKPANVLASLTIEKADGYSLCC